MKRSNQMRLLSFVLSAALLLIGYPCAAAQQEQPPKLDSLSANQAYKSFKKAEQDLGEKRKEKDKQIAKIYQKTQKENLEQLIAKLKKSLAEETQQGNLDEALEIRAGIAYFENLALGNTPPKATDTEATEKLPKLLAENRMLHQRIAALEARLVDQVDRRVGVSALDSNELTNQIGMQFRLIPAGRFMMGSETASDRLVQQFKLPARASENQFPQHSVTISKPFYMGTYEVTVGQFRAFVEATNYKTTAETDPQGGTGYDGKSGYKSTRDFSWRNPGFEQADNHPVTNVTWFDAVEFCKWLSRKEKVVYQLPSEAQWEYACRAGSTGMYYNGNDTAEVTKIANIADTSLYKQLGRKTNRTLFDGSVFTNEVGQYLPNDFGLHDMCGNVSEWCSDWYQRRYYSESPEVDPVGPGKGEPRTY